MNILIKIPYNDLNDDEKEKVKLRSKIGKLLTKLEKTELKEFLKKVANKPNTWEVFKKRIFSFRNKCQKLIRDYDSILQKEKEEKKQKKLFE